MHRPLATVAACLVASGPLHAQQPRAGAIEVLQTRIFDVGGLKVEAEMCRFSVPENRNDPDSNMLDLVFGRFKSTSPNPAAPLVYLAGGPGSSATSMADSTEALAAWRPVLEICDLILFDQRGTGRSKPSLRFSPEGVSPADLFGSEETARALAVEASRQAAAHFREQGVDITGYTTEQSADDLDALRRALGVEKISLFGFSYGTHLGLATIRRHGEHLENVILVGTEGPHQTHKFPSNADTQLRKLALLVASDPRVGPYVPDFVGLLERVLEKLDKEPMVVAVQDRSGQRVEVAVGKFGLQMILRFDIGDRSDLVVFPKLLYAIDQGDASVLRWFVQKRLGTFSSLNAMSLVMDGASGAPPGRWERIHAEAASGLLGNAMNFPYPDINEIWGTPDLGDDFRSPIVSDVRTLFLSGTLDWNTPPYQAEMVRFGFTNGTHIIVEGAGHEQVIPQPEVGRAIVAFLRGEDVSGVHVALPPLRFVPIEGFDPALSHPSASLAAHLVSVYESRGLDAALTVYREIRPALETSAEQEINALGYQLLGRGRVSDAITILSMNVEDYPTSWNAYDSLAEAYKEAGDRRRSIELYEKSLDLNPDNTNGIRMLESLGAR